MERIVFVSFILKHSEKQTNKQTDGCLALVGYPWLRKILVENIPLAKPFTIFWSWAYSYLSFRIFSWNKSIPSTVGKRNFSKTEIDLAPKCLFGGGWWGVAEYSLGKRNSPSENRQWFSSKMPIFGFYFCSSHTFFSHSLAQKEIPHGDIWESDLLNIPTGPLFTKRTDVTWPPWISRSLEAPRLGVIAIVSLWDLTGITEALPFKIQSDWKSLNLNLSAWSFTVSFPTLNRAGPSIVNGAD